MARTRTRWAHAGCVTGPNVPVPEHSLADLVVVSPGFGTPDNQMCRWDSRQPDTEYDGRPGCSTAGQELLVDIGEEDGELVEQVGMGGQVGVVADEVERDAPSESDQFEIGAQ